MLTIFSSLALSGSRRALFLCGGELGVHWRKWSSVMALICWMATPHVFDERAEEQLLQNNFAKDMKKEKKKKNNQKLNLKNIEIMCTTVANIQNMV